MLEYIRYVPATLAALCALWLFLRITADFFHRGIYFKRWIHEPRLAQQHGVRVGACFLSLVAAYVL